MYVKQLQSHPFLKTVHKRLKYIYAKFTMIKKKTYKYRMSNLENYDVKDPDDLLRYLRNVKVHFKQYNVLVSEADVDSMIRTHWNGFLDKVHAIR